MISGHTEQDRRGVDGLCQCPVHAVVHHRSSFPIGGVDDARRAVRVPRVSDRAAEQLLCPAEERRRLFRDPGLPFLPEGGEGPLGDEPRPLDAVARRRAVGLELVVLLIRIAVEIRLPVLREVFRNSPAVRGRPSENAGDDLAGADAVFFVLQRIRHRQECFYRMHVCVEAAVVIAVPELRVPGVAGQVFFFVPEIAVEVREGVLQQFFRPGTARKIRGTSRQDHEGVGIALLCGKRRPVRGKSRVPAAVLLVPKLPAEPLEPGIRQCRETVLLVSISRKHGSDAVNVGHPAGNPGLARPVLPGRAVIAQVPGAAARRRKSLPEGQKLIPQLTEIFAVFFCIEIIFPEFLRHNCLLSCPEMTDGIL